MCKNCEIGKHTKCEGSNISGADGDGCSCLCPMDSNYDVIDSELPIPNEGEEII